MHRRRTLVAALALAFAVLAAGCGVPNQRSELDDAINAAVVAAGNGGTIDMREVVAFDWDTMYAFGGYVTDDAIRKAVGTSWPSGGDEAISKDGLGLVVFVNDDTVAAWSVINDSLLPGPAVRFDQTEQPIPASSAVFSVHARTTTVSGYDLFYLTVSG
jgi:hypothetical protein